MEDISLQLNTIGIEKNDLLPDSSQETHVLLTEAQRTNGARLVVVFMTLDSTPTYILILIIVLILYQNYMISSAGKAISS